MIHKYSLAVLLFVCGFLSGFAQPWTENFDSQSSNSYPGTSIVINGRTWTKLAAGNFSYANTNMGSYAFTINDDSPGAHITTPVLNTCGTVSFEYAYINGNSANVFQLQVSTDGTTFTTLDTRTLGASANLSYVNYSFNVNSSNATTYVRILSDNQNAHLFIENFSVTAYSSCTPPANPSGTITGTTPACNATNLTFSGSATAPVVNYWQTSAAGTTTTDNASSAYNATATGTYYVRAFNSSTSCWSAGTVSYAVVINTPPTIDTQPVDETINEGDDVTFSVVSSDATSYTWEEFDGTSWSTIGTGASLTMTSVPVIKNGYQYRVILSNGNGCGTTVSDVVTLTVLTAACVDEEFNGGSTAPSGWTFTSIGTYTGVGSYGNASPSLQMNSSTDLILTSTFTNATELSFWIKGQGTNSVSAFLIEGYNGSSWVTVDNITNSIPTTGTVYTYNASSIPALPSNIQQFRFSYTKSAGNLALDDVRIYCGTPITGREINVTGNNSPIPDGSTSPSTGNNTNFGSTVIGNNIVKTFRIQNLGTANLTLTLPITLSDVSAPQEFVITQPGISVIPAGGSTTFTVTFNSAVAGLFTNTINIVNNDADENPYNFDIIATATTPPPPGTIYNPGELIFVGYDGQINGAGAEDEFLIATLVDMVQGTKFSIVNSRYEAGAAANIRTNKWGGGGDNASQQPYEAVITYNNATVIPKGSILRFVTNNSSNWFGTIQKIVGTTTTTITGQFSGSLPFALGSPNVSTSGSDQIFLMQGNFVFDGTTTANEANYFLNGQLLHGITNRSAWVSLTNPCNGDASGGNTRESRLPSALTCFNVENISGSAVSAFYENDKEHGLATIRQIILAVSDVSNNWTLGSGRYNLDPSDNTATSAGKTFAIGASNPPGQWVGNVNTNWFNCANWEGLKVPEPTTNVIINAAAINDAVVNYLANYSDDYADLASCNDLTINGKKVVIEGSINNKLEVNGNLLIEMSGGLDMEDGNPVSADGELYLAGNWTNKVGAAAFEEGNGTVIFQGASTQLINNYTPIPVRPTEEFYSVVLANDLNTNTSNDLHVNGNLTINTGKQLTVTDGRYVHVDNNLTNDGTFDILNNGSLIQVKNTGVNLGNISMERTANIKRQDYVYWASPVDGFSVDAVSPGSPSIHIYKWNPTVSNPNGGQGNWDSATGDIMAPGIGYIVRGPSAFNDTAAPYTALFNNGKPRNGIIDVPIYKGTYMGAAGYVGTQGLPITRYDDNWNLVGNPYPSAINSLDFLLLNTNLDGYVYLWTHETIPDAGNGDSFYQDFAIDYEPGDYIKYNSMGTASGPTGFNGFIGAGQAFMINMSDAGAVTSPGTVRFQNNLRNRAHDNAQFYRTASSTSQVVTADSHIEKHRIWIDLISDTERNSRLLVGYAEGATMERDRLYDAVTTFGGAQSFYSILDDEPFDIQGRALPFNDNDRIPLGVNIVSDGAYQIAIAAVDGIFDTDNQPIYLKDNLLNITYDLRSYPYSFSSEVGTFNNRFELVFQPQTLSVIENEIPTSGLTIIELPNGDVKFSVGNNLEIESVEIIDLLGRTIYQLQGNSGSEIYNLSNLSQAAYIAKVTLSNGQTITKRSVKQQ